MRDVTELRAAVGRARRRWPTFARPASLLAFAVGISLVVVVAPDPVRTPASGAGGTSLDVSAGTSDPTSATPGGGAGTTVAGSGPSGAPVAGGATAAGAAPTSTQDGPAGATAAAPAAGGGGGSSAPGVRPDAITLGIGVSDLGAVGALGPGYDQGDPVQHIEAILAQLRAEGRLPVHGRDIEPIYRSYSVISKDEQRAACEHLATDVEVFAVMALTHFGPGNECSAREHGIPTLTSDGQAGAVYERSAPNLRSLQVSADRLFRNFVAWADRAGLLDGKRIGVYHLSDAESVELVQASVLDELASRGHDVVVTVQTSETTGGPTDSVAVQQFATNRVDLAILLVSPIAKTNFFVQAQAQRYRPTYIENDYASSTTDTGTSTYPAEHFDGTRAVTMMRYGEASAGLEEGARARWCRDAIRRHAGRDIPRQGRDAEYISSNKSCDGVLTVLQALELAGPALTRDAFLQALDRAPEADGAIHGRIGFGPGRWDGGTQLRELQWRAGCRCWRAVGGFEPLLSD